MQLLRVYDPNNSVISMPSKRAPKTVEQLPPEPYRQTVSLPPEYEDKVKNLIVRYGLQPVRKTEKNKGFSALFKKLVDDSEAAQNPSTKKWEEVGLLGLSRTVSEFPEEPLHLLGYPVLFTYFQASHFVEWINRLLPILRMRAIHDGLTTGLFLGRVNEQDARRVKETIDSLCTGISWKRHHFRVLQIHLYKNFENPDLVLTQDFLHMPARHLEKNLVFRRESRPFKEVETAFFREWHRNQDNLLENPAFLRVEP